MHDEAQWEVAEKDAEVVGMLGVQAIVEAGRMLKLNVPLAGEYKIGNSWATTH
jgi:DNA polymerase I-like protein with 3'-5' exonuclease and polymerase domains